MNRSMGLCATGVGVAVSLVVSPPAAFATVRVAALIGDHMMVQLMGIDNRQIPSVLWNAMIAPLTPFPVAGTIWYPRSSDWGP